MIRDILTTLAILAAFICIAVFFGWMAFLSVFATFLLYLFAEADYEINQPTWKVK